MGLAGFNRRRRELAAKQAEADKAHSEQEKQESGQKAERKQKAR
ncbi:MAG: hypothetical protein SCK28_01485 [Bacillota bacterium]|nr:hypothetical protein [Bacillota bacterium]